MSAQVTPSIQISNVAIKQDSEGRYCLNDLHRASGNAAKHQPSNWLANQQTKELIEEVEKDSHGIPGLQIIKGTRTPGTYVVKELVYAYAMWISAKFHLQVIRAYDAQQQSPALPSSLADIERLIERKLAEARPLAQSVIDNKNYYSIHAARPGEFRWIFDVSIDQANQQLARQGLKIVSIKGG